MARLKAGQTVTLTLTVTDDNGDLEDATGLTFEWKQGFYGCVETVTPTRLSTGLYSVNIVPDLGGNVHYVWRSTASEICEEGVLSVKRSAFDLT